MSLFSRSALKTRKERVVDCDQPQNSPVRPCQVNLLVSKYQTSGMYESEASACTETTTPQLACVF
jgi:hypothetical protein